MGINVEELDALPKRGAEAAAVLWGILDSFQPAFDPHDIFKACSSIKCAELIASFKRTLPPEIFNEVLLAITKFLDATNKIVGMESGSLSNGMDVVKVFEKVMPISDDPAAIAVRLYTYHGVMLLAAEKFGKADEIKKCIEDMQDEIIKITLGIALNNLFDRLKA